MDVEDPERRARPQAPVPNEVEAVPTEVPALPATSLSPLVLA